MTEVQRLSDELRAELDRSRVNKRRVIELYSEIREISQEIADESFYDYLDIVDTLPISEDYYNSIFDIPDDLSPRMRLQAMEVQEMIQILQSELKRRPVDKSYVLELYFDIREMAQEIADEHFFNYLDTID